jgi:hypothetical protein
VKRCGCGAQKAASLSDDEFEAALSGGRIDFKLGRAQRMEGKGPFGRYFECAKQPESTQSAPSRLAL